MARRFVDIGKILTVPRHTVRKIVRTFVENGCNFANLGHQRVRFAMFSVRLSRILTNANLLQEWSPFSCKERVQMIERMWGVTTTPKTLAKFYREHQISYKSAKQVYKQAYKNAALEADRKVYAY